jgi:hypothetical protein
LRKAAQDAPPSDGLFAGGASLRGEMLLIGGQQVIGARAAAILGPSGGSVVDAEARASVDAILDALREHGLIGA